MVNAKYQILKSANGQYYFVLRAQGNHEVIMRSSETYNTNSGCRVGISACQINSPYDFRYERRPLSFTLKAANGEAIGVSEQYTTTQARENGIAAVKRDGPTKTIEDLS